MGIGETYTRLPPTEVFELFLNDPGTTTDDKLFLRQSLAALIIGALGARSLARPGWDLDGLRLDGLRL
jgi:hypothetical protein